MRLTHLCTQIGKIVAGLVMDSVHPLYAMIVIMLLVAAFNALFTLGTSLTALSVIWCFGRIVHVSRPCSCCWTTLTEWRCQQFLGVSCSWSVGQCSMLPI
jgi:sugar phosphate permease